MDHLEFGAPLPGAQVSDDEGFTSEEKRDWLRLGEELDELHRSALQTFIRNTILAPRRKK